MIRRRMLIGLDVDEVLACLLEEWLARFNFANGCELSPLDCTEWDLGGLTEPFRQPGNPGIYAYLHDVDLYDTVHMVPGAKTGVKALVEAGHDVVFVTSSVSGSASSKLLWLENLGFTEFGEVVSLTGRPGNIPDKGVVKLDALVDDAPHNLERITGAPILFRRPSTPWNHSENSRFPVAFGWPDVVGFFC